jgi:putative heme-binding domain-containing protein
LHALWTLEGIGELAASDVAAALDDAEPAVREHAVRLSERVTGLDTKLAAMTRDPAIRVRYQLAYTLRSRAALVELAARDGADRWIRTALLASVAAQPGAFYAALAARRVPITKELAEALAALVGARQSPTEIGEFVNRLENTGQSAPGLAGLARGLRLSGARALRVPGMEAMLARTSGQEAAWEVARYFDLPGLVHRAAAAALSAGTPLAARVRAIGALRGAPFAKAAPVLNGVLAGSAPVDVQVAAVLALSSYDQSQVAEALLRHWNRYSPEARVKAVGALLAARNRVPLLLEALERGAVEPAALDIAARSRLLESTESGVADRARRIFQDAGGDRARLLAQYKDVARMNGDPARGQLAFAEHCGRCHMPRRQGGRVGPDLSGINNKTREELLEAILNPSAAIESRYVNYVVTTRDGRMFDGVLAAETPGAITLRGGAEEDVTIPRSRIAGIRASSISLMPDELEKGMSKQALADVIAYLRGGL